MKKVQLCPKVVKHLYTCLYGCNCHFLLVALPAVRCKRSPNQTEQ